MPFNVPVENGIAVARAAKDLDGTRELVKNYEAVDEEIEVILPDYEKNDYVFLEAFTLDSAQCAACQYMWFTCQDAKEKYGDKVRIIEYKYNNKDNIARCKKVGVQNLPTLYIEGEPKYVSIIPGHDEFYAEIEKYLAQKGLL